MQLKHVGVKIKIGLALQIPVWHQHLGLSLDLQRQKSTDCIFAAQWVQTSATALTNP